MKVFLWLLTTAGTLVCLTGWLIAELFVRSMRETGAGVPIPEISRMVLFPHGWMIAAPVPWIVYASVLSLRRKLRHWELLVFAGGIVLFTTAFVCVEIVALVLVYLPRRP